LSGSRFFSRHLFNIAILPFSVKGFEKYFLGGGSEIAESPMQLGI
jgi:hypothetical protein